MNIDQEILDEINSKYVGVSCGDLAPDDVQDYCSGCPDFWECMNQYVPLCG